MALSANGWQNQTKMGAATNAEHIHSNCDCTYAVRFNENDGLEGYYPDRIEQGISMALKAQGMDPDVDSYRWDQMNPEVINAVRRQNYAKHREEIRAQQNSAAEKRRELNSSKAEESEA